MNSRVVTVALALCAICCCCVRLCGAEASFSPVNIVARPINRIASILASDLNADGRLDILVGSSRLSWFENLGGGAFSPELVIDGSAVSARIRTMFLADLDGDGRQDLLTGTTAVPNDSVAWYRKTNHTAYQNTSKALIATNETSPCTVLAADLDNDLDMDVVVATDLKDGEHISVYVNNGTGGFASKVIVTDEVQSPLAVLAADLNGDSFVDLVSCSNKKISWYRNSGLGSLSNQIVLPLLFSPDMVFVLGDVNNDSFIDVVFAQKSSFRVFWARNLGTPDGNFSSPILISVDAIRSQVLVLYDLDADSDLDLIGSSRLDRKVAVYTNDGAGNFGPQNVVSTTVDYIIAIAPADVDDDGDVDLLVGSASLDLLGWFANGCPAIDPFVEFGYYPGSYPVTCSFSFVPLIATVSCLANPGRWAVPINASLCVCPVGFRLLTTSDCVPCAADTFGDRLGMLGDCDACPTYTSTYSMSGSNSSAACLCLPGFYTLDAPGSACLACPAHATCAGAAALPVALPGYAAVPGIAEQFVECPRREACLGGTACLTGYTGAMCKNCAPGFFAQANGQCERCVASSNVWFAVLVLFILLLALALTGAVLLSAARLDADLTSASGASLASVLRRRILPTSLGQIIIATQIVHVLALASFGWPTLAKRVLNLARVFSLETPCLLASPSSRIAFCLAVPPVLALLVAAFLAVSSRFYRLRPSRYRERMVSLLWLAGPVLYLPVTSAALSVFDCTRLADGRYYLDSDMALRCFDAHWSVSLLPLGVLGAVYVLGLPCTLAACLYRHRNSLFVHRSVAFVHGTAYRQFRRAQVHMPVLLLLKLFGLACCSQFLSRLQGFQFTGFALLIVGGGLAQLHTQPYFVPLHDLCDAVLTGWQAALLLCGLVAYSQRVPASRSGSEPSSVVSALVIVATVGFFASCGYFVVRDVRACYQCAPHDSGHERRLRKRNRSVLCEFDDDQAAALLTSLTTTSLVGLEELKLPCV